MCDTKAKEYSVSELEVLLEMARLKKEISTLESTLRTSTPATGSRAATATQLTHPPAVTSEVPTSRNSYLDPTAVAWSPSPIQNSLSCLQQQMAAQQEACMSMAASVRESVSMPKPEIVSFDGNPKNYFRFIRSFDANIGHKMEDEGLKLNYLIQFCKEEARDAIEGCVILDPREGYSKARDILQRRFGRPHTIARTMLQEIATGPAIRANDGEALLKLSSAMQQCEMTLEQMSYNTDMNSFETLLQISRRLPSNLKSKWVERVDHLLEQGREPTFHDLAEFVEKRARVATTLYSQSLFESGKPDTHVKQAKTGKFATAMVTQSVDQTCLLCNERHELEDCTLFVNSTYEQRKQVSRGNGLCDNCLRKGHRSRQCGLRSRCTVTGCTWKHSTLLHPPTAPTFPVRTVVQSNLNSNPVMAAHAQATAASNQLPPSSVPLPPVTTQDASTPVQDSPQLNTDQKTHSFAIGGADHGRVMLRIVAIKVHGRSRTIETYALLDECSDVSLCERSLVDDLGLEGQDKSFQLTTMSDEGSTKHGKEVALSISSMDGSESIDMGKVWTVDKIPINAHSIPTSHDLKKWPHLQGINFPLVGKTNVTVLIGSDTPEAFWHNEERRGQRGEPYAMRSPLGWSVIGPTAPLRRDQGSVNLTRGSDALLREQMERLWESDFNDHPQGKKSMSVEDKRALKLFEESAVTVDGHLQVSLPWRRNPPNLQNNKKAAETRLRSLKRRLKNDEGLRASYREVMADYVSKGHAGKAPPCSPGSVVWYLPHHPVINPKKQKPRIVFDCAARFNERSLNDELLQGPDLTNSLVGVLHRFRQKPIAVSGDVEAMFHQVRVTPSDCNALRFLWWSDDDLDKEPEEYQMLVHLFGATSSPSVCCWALRQTAVRYGERYDPKVLAVVDRNFYVDDCLLSVDSVQEARQIVKDVTSLLQEGGFRLTKWLSNSREVMSSIPDAERAKSVVDLDLDELPMERALGMSWNVEKDCFQFTSVIKEKPATKRGLLSVISSLYDPLGFVAPVTLNGKRLLQELCRQQVGWDEPIDDDITAEWNEWLSSLHVIEVISIRRCFIPEEFQAKLETELHIFADASEVGYGAVAYLRISCGLRVQCAFVSGKSRLAPLKHITIPRLELTAAVVAARMKVLLEQELEMKLKKTVMWTDSTAVLQYIRNERSRFKTFVANRLSEIHDASESSQWRYVDSAQNPADIASRGLKTLEAEHLQKWIDGPEFLKGKEEVWPKEPGSLPEIDVDEIKHTMVCSGEESSVIDELLRRYSSWYKLMKAVAWILRFKLYCVGKWIERDTEGCSRGPITVEELHRSEAVIIQYVQQKALKKSDLKKLNPMTRDGLMRVGGRLEHAPIEFEAKHPIILPSRHHVTMLIIRHHHEAVGHSGCDFVLNSVRQRFWVVKGRASVKREIGQCMICKKRSVPRGEQFMAPLPALRVTPDKPPFSFTGVDYFGPLFVKQGRSIVNRYGCLFTCMTTRAVHIEIAHSLDTDSFLGALQRFISRRGKPERLLSDNGTNFKGADRELRGEIEKWNKAKIEDSLLQQEIQWSFNPPGASHMGGVWERMIRTTRRILKVLTNEQLMKDETLSTLMAEVERIINDRPLTPPSSDPTDVEPLTPSKLLLLKQNPCLPPGVFDSKDQYVRRWYKQAQYLANVFWRRWLKEYLPSLQQRQKWTSHQRNFKAGDLVLLVDDRVSRGKWPLGRVMKVIADGDGDVRSAEVKTATGYKYRPITKLCFLEADNQDVNNEGEDNVVDDEVDINSEDSSDDQTIPVSRYIRPKRTTKAPSKLKDFVR